MGSRASKARSVRRELSTFMSDPLQSVAVHGGKLLDKTSLSLKDIPEIAIMSGLAYFGYESELIPPFRPASALSAVLGYKLATSPMGAGTPPVAQIVGIALLGRIAGMGMIKPILESIAGIKVPTVSPDEAAAAINTWIDSAYKEKPINEEMKRKYGEQLASLEAKTLFGVSVWKPWWENVGTWWEEWLKWLKPAEETRT